MNGSSMSVNSSSAAGRIVFPESSSAQSATSTAESDQQELRSRILLIQRDESLSAQEKAKKVQRLMTLGWLKFKQEQQDQEKHVGAMDVCGHSPSLVSAHTSEESNPEAIPHLSAGDAKPTFHNEFSQTLGCSHYQRKVKMQASCCKKWVTCRFCHDEGRQHQMKRQETKWMMCMGCSTVQSPAQSCVSCHMELAKYFCQVCKFWDNDPNKSIFHCFDCGMCRVGKGLGIDYFHCDKCNICLAMSMKGNHKCIERNLECDCPICGDFLFTSTATVIFMPCGHSIHYKCHQEYIQTSYQCPTCFKSLTDMKDYFRRIDSMLESHQMPAEYQSTSSLVYCNDCETKSTTKFHFLYHKCQNCAGYNTKVLQTVDQSKGDAPVTVVSVAGETSQSTGVSVHDITVTQDPSEDSEMSDSHEMLSSSPENTSSATLNQVSGLPERLSFLGEPAPFETATDTSSGRRDYSNGASGPPHV